MTAIATPPTREELGVIAEGRFARAILPNLRPEDEGMFVAIDAASDDFRSPRP